MTVTLGHRVSPWSLESQVSELPGASKPCTIYLRAHRLARYRAQLLEPASKSGGAGTGFDVQKSGDARVALIGFPSVGKVEQIDSIKIVAYLMLYSLPS